MLGHGSPRATVQVQLATALAEVAARQPRNGRGLHGRAVGVPGPDRRGARGRAQRRGASTSGAAGSRRCGSRCRPCAASARATRARAAATRIAAHYDLGNEFFALMLDETMMYSSAYFPRRGMTLAQASRAKLELVCRQARPAPRRPRAGDRHGMGRLRRPRRATRGAAGSRPPRSRASSTSMRARGCGRRESPIGSRCCARTTATCAGATTSSSASR